MFINKSRNKSGTTSVRVLQKRGRNNVLVKSFGSFRDESEIKRMEEQAREFIQRQTGTYYNLFNPPPKQDVEDFIEGLSNSQISVAGPEAVFGKLFDYQCIIASGIASKAIYAYASAHTCCNLRWNACLKQPTPQSPWRRPGSL